MAKSTAENNESLGAGALPTYSLYQLLKPVTGVSHCSPLLLRNPGHSVPGHQQKMRFPPAWWAREKLERQKQHRLSALWSWFLLTQTTPLGGQRSGDNGSREEDRPGLERQHQGPQSFAHDPLCPQPGG